MKNEFINWPENFDIARNQFESSEPFNYLIIDDFFKLEVIDTLAAEFPPLDSPAWYSYENSIEKKYALNSWDRFGQMTYKTLSYLNSVDFLDALKKISGIQNLECDVGLNGGGLHAHGRGGKLNVHLDYSIHPKLQKERRLNLIVYLTPGWRAEWGGGLQLWTHDETMFQPKDVHTTVDNRFNRAVIFDTTQNSWHGLPDAINCPEGTVRRSLATYYLSQPRAGADKRGKALFAPHIDQKGNQEVLDLIKVRSGTTTAADAYRKK